ncbi:PR domain zinc finger protein 5-like [Cydia fagiglandana]|uniref:PR domain zinc finger protein 5-like n=1 Tax=Cydia fagiglandana TaxID=1458189 RepID=UPI002FEE2683
MAMFNELTFSASSQPKPALAKLRNILNTPRFCTLCYESAVQLQDLDNCPLVDGSDICTLTLRQILHELFQDAGSRIVLSKYICDHCQAKLVYSYQFIRSVNNRAENFNYYLTQLDSETIDLLNCMADNPACANAVIVLEETASNENGLEKLEKFKWHNNQPVKEKVHIIERPSRHLITKNYRCGYCNKEFCDKKFLLTHFNTCGLCKIEAGFNVENSVPFENILCPKCKKRPCEHEKFIKYFFDQKEDAVVKTKCLECPYTASMLQTLISHVDKKHMDMLADNCELCGKLFYLREQYFSHFDTFHPDYKICFYCSCVIPSESLYEHEAECTVTEKTYSCDKCPSKFENDMQASIHAMAHEDIPKKPKKIVLKRSYSCPLCKETFTGKLKLQKHCNDAHGVESYRNNHCQFCDIKFTTKKEYLLHIREMQHFADINPNHSYRHKCQYCDYTARHSFILKTHMNRYHLKVMPFECDICNKRFLDKRKLKAHIDRHMGKGKTVCSICGDTLGSTTALIKHTRLHTGERPYPCHLCDVSLNSASERKFHVLRKHTEKTHPCPICETKFHTPYFVRRHIQQVHWKRKEKFDHTKVEGLKPEHYELFRDRRMVVL